MATLFVLSWLVAAVLLLQQESCLAARGGSYTPDNPGDEISLSGFSARYPTKRRGGSSLTQENPEEDGSLFRRFSARYPTRRPPRSLPLSVFVSRPSPYSGKAVETQGAAAAGAPSPRRQTRKLPQGKTRQAPSEGDSVSDETGAFPSISCGYTEESAQALAEAGGTSESAEKTSEEVAPGPSGIVESAEALAEAGGPLGVVESAEALAEAGGTSGFPEKTSEDVAPGPSGTATGKDGEPPSHSSHRRRSETILTSLSPEQTLLMMAQIEQRTRGESRTRPQQRHPGIVNRAIEIIHVMFNRLFDHITSCFPAVSTEARQALLYAADMYKQTRPIVDSGVSDNDLSAALFFIRSVTEVMSRIYPLYPTSPKFGKELELAQKCSLQETLKLPEAMACLFQLSLSIADLNRAANKTCVSSKGSAKPMRRRSRSPTDAGEGGRSVRRKRWSAQIPEWMRQTFSRPAERDDTTE